MHGFASPERSPPDPRGPQCVDHSALRRDCSIPCRVRLCGRRARRLGRRRVSAMPAAREHARRTDRDGSGAGLSGRAPVRLAEYAVPFAVAAWGVWLGAAWPRLRLHSTPRGSTI